MLCRLYNQSAYIVTQLLNFELKLHVKSIKKLHDQKVIVCGFPTQSIVKYFPEAKKTRWGYELKGDWGLKDYTAWQEELVAQAASEARHAVEYLNNNIELSLTEFVNQQVGYLSAWQKNNKIADGHIDSLDQLKNYLDSLLWRVKNQ